MPVIPSMFIGLSNPLFCNFRTEGLSVIAIIPEKHLPLLFALDFKGGKGL